MDTINQTHFDAQAEALATQLATLLLARQWSCATAESCTGGWIAQVLTRIAGSSEWFDRGFVTYSNAAKQDMLGVSSATLAQQGAVSEACVREMVTGAVQHSLAHCAIAVSGVAGPGGGSSQKPVGTVWLAWQVEQAVWAQCYQFSGDRQQVREQSVLKGLAVLVDKVASNVH